MLGFRWSLRSGIHAVREGSLGIVGCWIDGY